MTTTTHHPVTWDDASVPTHCELCAAPITAYFYDARLPRGPWGCICPTCFSLNNCSLGTGRGQLYTHQPNGDWLKTAG